MKTTPSDNYAAFVGLDWADRSHHVCLRVADSERDELSELPQEPNAIHAWAIGLQTRPPADGSPSRWSNRAGRCSPR